jgi:hypothetical protein
MRTLCRITEMKYLYCLDNGIVRTYHVSPHPRCAVYRCYVLLQRCPPPCGSGFYLPVICFHLSACTAAHSHITWQTNAVITLRPHIPTVNRVIFHRNVIEGEYLYILKAIYRLIFILPTLKICGTSTHGRSFRILPPSVECERIH